MSEDGNQLLYDIQLEGYSGLLKEDSFLHMYMGGAPGGGGAGDASALLQQTTLQDGFSGHVSAEIGGGSSSDFLVEEHLYGSTYHHHAGRRQYYTLDPPAFPMFVPAASNLHDLAPPPTDDGTPSPATSTVLYDVPPWAAAQMGLFHLQSRPAGGSSLQWLPNEWGGGGFEVDPFTRAVAGGGSVCVDGEVDAAEGWARRSASTVLGFGLRRPREREEGRGSNNTERQRRGKMSEKFGVLRSLIPNPRGKHDKASILTEATDYIRELLRTIGDLRCLVEAKQRIRTDGTCWRPSGAAAPFDEAGILLMENSTTSSAQLVDPAAAAAAGRRPSCCSAALLPRCSWLQRSYEDGSSVDVRIVEDDVAIKLVRRTGTDCLLLVSRALHELRLDLLHLAAANIGDSLVLLINSKIEEGSSSVVLSAGVIAKNIVEALEGTVLFSF